jgi:hypothetical protein
MLRNGNDCGKTKLMRISRQSSTVHILIDQKQLDNVEYLNYLQCLVRNDAICIRAIQSRISMAEAAFYKRRLIRQQIGHDKVPLLKSN